MDACLRISWLPGTICTLASGDEKRTWAVLSKTYSSKNRHNDDWTNPTPVIHFFSRQTFSVFESRNIQRSCQESTMLVSLPPGGKIFLRKMWKVKLPIWNQFVPSHLPKAHRAKHYQKTKYKVEGSQAAAAVLCWAGPLWKLCFLLLISHSFFLFVSFTHSVCASRRDSFPTSQRLWDCVHIF